MKKYIKQITLLIIGLILVQSCDSDEKTIDFVFDNVTNGATLKTIDPINPTFDFFDPSVEWEMLVEFRDHLEGTSLSEVRIYATHIGVDGNSSEGFISTIPESEFAVGPSGFPQGILHTSLMETLDALGLSEGEYGNTDQFRIRLDLVLNDGRVFTNNASGNVSGGSFFSSPFQYSVQFFCSLTDASLFDGTYIVTNDVWADYNPGDEVPVIPDENDPLSFRILSTNNPFILNPNTSYMLCKIDPVTGDVTVTSNEDFDYGGGFLLPVTGTGNVGTCTGDINLILDFGAFTNQAFNLVKK